VIAEEKAIAVVTARRTVIGVNDVGIEAGGVPAPDRANIVRRGNVTNRGTGVVPVVVESTTVNVSSRQASDGQRKLPSTVKRAVRLAGNSIPSMKLILLKTGSCSI